MPFNLPVRGPQFLVQLPQLKAKKMEFVILVSLAVISFQIDSMTSAADRWAA